MDRKRKQQVNESRKLPFQLTLYSTSYDSDNVCFGCRSSGFRGSETNNTFEGSEGERETEGAEEDLELALLMYALRKQPVNSHQLSVQETRQKHDRIEDNLIIMNSFNLLANLNTCRSGTPSFIS